MALIHSLLSFLFLASGLSAGTVNYTVSLTLSARPISSLVYGGQENVIPASTLRRVGGNRMTGYNWENNASSAGNDWLHNSDYWLLSLVGLPQNGSQGPARFVRERINQARADSGQAELITIQASGYVAADGLGVVSAAETAPSARWKNAILKKGSAFTLTPSTADANVYMDEFINYLQSTYGMAGAGGVKYYGIDNEPDLWSSTHPRIHPAAVSYVEMAWRTTATASAILDQDPAAEVFGLVSYGFDGYVTLSGAPDSGTYNPTYGWFLGFLLDRARVASLAQGRRLMHYLALNWYPEAQGLNASGVWTRIVFAGGSDISPGVCAARIQAPRSLWDPSYVETSWIASYLGTSVRILPRVQQRIDQYYPATKIAISEWQYGTTNHISVGLATVDALGIFGERIDAACHWDGPFPYTTSAFRMYRNVDGAGKKFGDRALTVTASSWTTGSIHAAYDSLDPLRLTVIVLNKDAAATVSATVNLGLPGGQSISSVQAWRLGTGSSSIVAVAGPISFTAASFYDSQPAWSATFYELQLISAGSPTFTPFVTATPTRTATPSFSATSSRTSTPSSSPTATPSRTASPTLTATPSPSATSSSSPSPTETNFAGTSTSMNTPAPSFTPTSSPTPTLTVSSNTSPTVTLTPDESATVSPTLPPSPAETPTGNGLPIIDAALPQPNPNPVAIIVKLKGPADSLRLQIWTSGMQLISEQISAIGSAGWNTIKIPQEFFGSAGNGTYYFSVVASQGLQLTQMQKPGKFVVLK